MTNLFLTRDGELDNNRRIQDTDYELKWIILKYVLAYPDPVCHPREDVIYQTLIHLHSEPTKELCDLEANQKGISKQTRAFAGI